MRRRIKGQRVYNTSQVSSSSKKGLLGNWSRGGSGNTWPDSSNFNNEGVITGATWTLGESSRRDAMEFNGSSDYVSMGDLSATEDKSFSYTFWIKTTQTGTGRFIIGEGSTASANPITAVSMENGKARLFVRASGDIQVISTTSINDGEWHHVAGTADGTTGRIYVDGVFETSGGLPGGALALNTFTVGALERTSVALFTQAIIDDPAIYDRCLSDAEVYWLATNGPNYVNPMKPRRYNIGTLPPTIQGISTIQGITSITF